MAARWLTPSLSWSRDVIPITGVIALITKPVLVAAVGALTVMLIGVGIYAGLIRIDLADAKVEVADLRAARATDAAAAQTDRATWEETNRRKERDLTTAFNRSLEARDAQVRSATITADELRRRLRAPTITAVASADRASGGGADTGVTAYPAGSIGALLSGSAQPLVDEAHRGEVIRAGLKQCYRDLDAARAAMKSLSALP